MIGWWGSLMAVRLSCLLPPIIIKVWRVAVRDKWTTDEANIKIRFNALCRQFAKNEKYLPLNDKPELLEEERIGYEMMVNNKGMNLIIISHLRI